jgi:hypothetical protein
MSPQETAALAAVTISAIGVTVTFLSSRWQFAQKAKELELKQAELDKVGIKLQAEAFSLQQNFMKDVIARRMNAYAAVWRVIIEFGLNWKIEGKSIDNDWATEFLLALNKCNAEHGVFFSEDVYRSFFAYREVLIDIVKRTREGGEVSEAEVDVLTVISTKGLPGMKSLAGALKDDLGSYLALAIRTT